MGHRKIAFVEIEPIFKEGLSVIAKKDKINCTYVSFSSLDDLMNYKQCDSIDIAIVSSSINADKIKKIGKFRTDFSNIKWLGLVSSAYKRAFNDVMDKIIYVSDSVETILKNIRSLWVDVESSPLNENVLSDREIDVLKLLVSGKQNKEIAEILCISIHTVVSHRKNITHKLGVKSLAAMAIYAVSKNIIDLNESMSLIK